MGYDDILYRVENGVAVITLNRPDKLNAWRAQMDQDVRAAMRAATDDAGVRLIVLTGAGRGFCAGADLGAGGETFDYRARMQAAGADAAGLRADAAEQESDVPRDNGGQFTLRIFASTNISTPTGLAFSLSGNSSL